MQKDVARIEGLLVEAIESDPNQPMAYAIMGILRRLQSRLTESRLAFERAISLDPNFEWANMQLGWTLLFLGGPGNAIAHGEKSLRLSPRDPNIFWRYELLGFCQLLSNDVDEAIDLFIKPEVNSLAQWYAFLPWASKISAPKFWALQDKTLNEGLRRIGFPEN